MATMIPNSFTSWALSIDEELQGSQLTLTQTQVIQNHRAMLAEQKNALDYDPEHMMEFVQRDHHLKGQIEVLTWLLAQSESVEERIREETRINSTFQNSDLTY